MNDKRFSTFAWMVLSINIAVILWGAYVRATGSGAGCGSHWPLCNGVVLPRAPQMETLIEYIHRLSSGLVLALVGVLFVWAFKAYPSGNKVRIAASFSLVFIVTEALIGAGLVLFGWVAEDGSIGRIVSISLHLINTLLLLAALSLTAWWSLYEEQKRTWFTFKRIVFDGIGLMGVLILGVSGAITALGDTLFPSSSLLDGLRADFQAQAHFLIRLRVWHPVIALVVGIYWLGGIFALLRVAHEQRTRRLAKLSGLLIVVQLFAGGINLLLLAPVWMQLVHLLLADLVWISLILFTFSQGEEMRPYRLLEGIQGAQ